MAEKRKAVDPGGLHNRLVFSTDAGDLRKQKPDAAPTGPQKQGAVRVWLDTKSRRGKVVTRITGVRHCPEALQDLAKELKVLCGAGGTVEVGDILVQGDHRERVTKRLRELGYSIK